MRLPGIPSGRPWGSSGNLRSTRASSCTSQPTIMRKEKDRRGVAAVRVTVKEVRGECALGLRPGDHFDARDFYIVPNGKICLHALGSMKTFLYAMLKGVKPSEMGIGDDVAGYVRCPDPGPPLTCGGSVLFELRILDGTER